MSEIIDNEETGIQYILNDTEFILNPSDIKNNEINDVFYTDGNQTIVVNGHFVQEAGETPTLVLQDGEDISQYFINDNQGELLITDIENSSLGHSQENQIVQYIDEDGNITDAADVVYVNEDGIPVETQDISSSYQISELMDTVQNSYNEVQEVESNIVDFETLTAETEADNSLIGISPTDWYQCAVVRDGNIYITNNEEHTYQDTYSTEQSADVSAITGKNLITGQVVSLESYMDKIKKRIKSDPSNSANNVKSRTKHNLNAFMNKKFNLGLTVGGKQLMGKIVHVESRDTSIRELDQQIEMLGSEIVNANEPVNDGDEINNLDRYDTFENFMQQNVFKNEQMHVQTKLLSRKSDQFQRISKTLSDLMNMENIKKKVVGKSIHIEIVDRYISDTKKVDKNVSFISGYMESKIVSNIENKLTQEWTFVPDTLRTENVKSNIEKRSQKKYPNVINLTITTTHQKNNKSLVKVIINSNSLECQYCHGKFNNKKNWADHINGKHLMCEVCNNVFHTKEEVLKHKEKSCSKATSQKKYLAESVLKQNANISDPIQYELSSNSEMTEKDLELQLQLLNSPNCEQCGDFFATAAELSAHKRTNHLNHPISKKQQTTKYYACDICKRTFSRQSNLQRHAEIHKGAEQLYWCAICGCSYHYISSLTRHIVQNHVELQRPNFAPIESGNNMNL